MAMASPTPPSRISDPFLRATLALPSSQGLQRLVRTSGDAISSDKPWFKTESADCYIP